jgi:dihydrofolate synthase/folylpolyglutamate synthase
MISDFTELEKYLQQFRPSSMKHAYTLDRMTKLMGVLGNPQEKINIVHVAGTSGKTSTVYYISALLMAGGAKVGTSVSPHINNVNERVQINGQPIPEVKFCKLFSSFVALPGVIESQPTYFELLTAFAFWVFAETGCTHAVIEVGLGGLLDATNVITNPNKISVITDIGFDHMHILGHTLLEITQQKAGIIQPGNQVFCLQQSSLIVQEISRVAKNRGAKLHIKEQVQNDQSTLAFDSRLPLFQQRNWTLAKYVYDYVAVRDNLTVLSQRAQLSTQKIFIPARMQIAKIAGRDLVMDGAHNPQKLEALVASLRHMYPNKTFAILAAFLSSKHENIVESLEILAGLSNNIIFTEFSLSADLPHKTIDSKLLADMANKLGVRTANQPDTRSALKQLAAQKADILLVTGSLYLISSLAGRGVLKEL